MEDVLVETESLLELTGSQQETATECAQATEATECALEERAQMGEKRRYKRGCPSKYQPIHPSFL
jgi:hypothetical protein